MFLVPGIIVIRCVGTSKNSVLLIFRKRCFRELVAFFIKVAVSGCIQLPNINISLSSNCNSLWPAVRECLTGGFLRAVSHKFFVSFQVEQHAAPRNQGRCVRQA